MRTYLLSIATLTLALGVSSCGSEEKKVEETVEIPMVEVSQVYEQSVPQIKQYTATIEAENTNNIAPSSYDRITVILADVGDRVSRGQILVKLDTSAVSQLRIRRDLAKAQLDRAINLVTIGSGTQQAVDQCQAEYDALNSQYLNRLENTVLRSPINGVVTARNYDPGDMTSTLPVLTVGQLSPTVKVLVNVTEGDFTKVKVGMPVNINLDVYEGETFTGAISQIYPTIDPLTRTFTVEVKIQNPGERIRPGMFARVNLDLGAQNNVVVPDRAVVKQTGSGNQYVYVYHNGTVSYNKVELGQRLGDSYEIISGVNPGDSVVISGQAKLINGSQVELLKK
ncbi:MAG: efflux RND transporter periplasmic adaptor subunit [Muribaculaceae bacterium]|nr:efflux RND transporter periplasmic adaptor subunit [Muribaculaceae bacterium]